MNKDLENETLENSGTETTQNTKQKEPSASVPINQKLQTDSENIQEPIKSAQNDNEPAESVSSQEKSQAETVNEETTEDFSKSKQTSEPIDDYKYTQEDLDANSDYKYEEVKNQATTETAKSDVSEKDPKEDKPEKKKTGRKVAAVIIAVIIIIILLLLRSCGGCGSSTNPSEPSQPGLEVEGDNKWDGTIHDSTETAITETIEIPGYSDLGVSKDSPFIRLGNPEANTVYLQYQIVKNGEVIYETKAIKPGNMVEANMYDVLDTGENEVTININTYDVETETACNGATQTVTITVHEK